MKIYSQNRNKIKINNFNNNNITTLVKAFLPFIYRIAVSRSPRIQPYLFQTKMYQHKNHYYKMRINNFNSNNATVLVKLLLIFIYRIVLSSSNKIKPC